MRALFLRIKKPAVLSAGLYFRTKTMYNARENLLVILDNHYNNNLKYTTYTTKFLFVYNYFAKSYFFSKLS